MTERGYVHEANRDLRAQGAFGTERDRLAGELRDKITKLDEQARIFIPLIALCVIAAIPVWAKSPLRFLALLLNPFVLLPLAFCIIHLALAWRGIAKARNRMRDWERSEENRAKQ